jgi:four helix bundle protein
MNEEKENLILKLTFDFSLKIIDFCEQLDEIRKFALSNQLLKAGTSIGANANEAQNAESKADFIHKLKIAAKEMDETEYWLLLCQYSPRLPDPGDLLSDLTTIKKVINRIIGTSKNNKTDSSKRLTD